MLATPLMAVAGQIEHVEVEKYGERYFIEGEITINAPVHAVYRLITDYDALNNLDKGIAESRLVERLSDNTAMVYTSLTGCIVFFCRKVERMERVLEVSDSEIVAEVVPFEGSNVAYGRSQWTLHAEQSGTRIVFNSQVQPDFWIPPMLGPALIKKVLKKRVTRTLDNLEQAAKDYE